MQETRTLLNRLAALQYALALLGLAVAPDWVAGIEPITLLPLAGMCVHLVRRWSQPVFLCALLWSATQYYLTWKTHAGFPHFLYAFFVLAADALVVSWFLIPAVRRTHFVPPMNWWRTSPRFQLRLSAVLIHQHRKGKVTLSNLAEGGAFIRTGEDLEPGDPIEIRFSVLARDFAFRATVRYALKGAAQGYGIQFDHTPESTEWMQRLVYCLEILGVERSKLPAPWNPKIPLPVLPKLLKKN